MDLVLVRHAEPLRIELAEGPANPPLTERGLQQADATGRFLSEEPFDVLYTSPMQRARQTADAIAKYANGLEVRVSEDLREYDADSNTYIPYEELKAAKDPNWQALAENRLEDVMPEGDEFRIRVITELERIIQEHAGQRVLAVCHGGVINVYLADVLGMSRSLWLEAHYAGVSRVVASRNGARSVASVNEAGHLRGLI